MKSTLKMISVTLLASVIATSIAQAEGLQLKAQQAKPTANFQAAGAPKPPACAQGFTPVGMKLQEHEGKKWYEYQCAYQQNINRTCNADTDVTEVKDQIISLPSDEQSHKSKMMLSYKCFHYVPVK